MATAENGRDADRLLTEFVPDLYHRLVVLLIMDIFMPAVDGLETIKAIREKIPAARIIPISGGSPIRETDVPGWAKVWGAEHVFQKPLDRKDLLDAVKACLEPTDQ